MPDEISGQVTEGGTPVEDAVVAALRQEDAVDLSQAQATEIEALAKLTDENGEYIFEAEELFADAQDYHVVAHKDGGNQRRGQQNYPYVEGVGDAIDSVLYNEGDGEEDWEEGFQQGSGIQEKREDSLHLEASGDGDNERSWVTSNAINFDAYSDVQVEWEGYAPVNGVEESGCFIVVSTDKNGDHTVFDGRIGQDETFERKEDRFDISGLSGDLFVRFHVIDNFDFERGYEADMYIIGLNE